MKWTNYKDLYGGGNNGWPATLMGGNTDDNDWQDLLDQITGGLSDYSDPYLSQLDPLVAKWLDPNYKAYSPERMQEMYGQGKGQLEGDIFKSWDEGHGRSMANQGLTGSGVDNLAYGKILGQKGGALEDLWSGLQERNESATRSDRSQATALAPIMSQMKNWPMEQKMQLFNTLTSDKNATAGLAAQQKGANAEGLGEILSFIISLLSL